MPSKGRNHCQSLPSNVLSDLPDNVIDVILMCLPCKDAIRTSILSKKWRYNWCRRTEFTVDVSHWKTQKDLLYPTVKFIKIIYPLLTLHEGPITKFTLDMDILKSCPEIDNFIYFLSRNGIQHLFLRFPRYNGLYKLSSSLFTCSQLRHLTLHNCSIHPPSAFKGFDWLISLKLCRVTISPEWLGSLISHCPLLERLELEELMSEVINIIDINAPMLRYFDFHGSIKSVCLKNVPLLTELALMGARSPMEAKNFDLAKLFKSCSALEHLALHIHHSEFQEEEPSLVPTRLPFDLNHVKCFYLLDPMLEESYKLSCALCLIRSFPYLEYLEIRAVNDYDGGADLECLKMERFSDVTFNHLREVKLESGTISMPVMQLIKLLLAKSPVLVRILIRLEYPSAANERHDLRLKILAKVSNFLHASPKADVDVQYQIRFA
ncbi:F-box/FBD/LRR-repeat protein At1g13570-like [Lycium ferocissimum]|uniref:F-box/FBD/LRR-repeat protein At1g13570-like n=1 Tax=Lycium ferocissimum TaxID=112874 RepID=UPI002814FC9C|nr:F-box/FBD/LRR-repeat protein At1g13570-like [Lycium ferocissimum]XP_059285497.1 F-box/FBD/LRR-repeat protein At1g13570-like [Lycium ferocissimum]XP_059285506.1 F-box/FBD/LRR-repeat protein At1g13570-like [Lycium ferocissimum]